MIIRELNLTNFGIFGGTYSFNLRPNPSERFNRPIVLLSGKNGVGKTTFVEAIRLCIHGSVARGSRVSQKEYQEYLHNRIHRPLNGLTKPERAVVEIVFDYVADGKKRTYRVHREWKRSARNVHEELLIWEDDMPLTTLAAEQQEEFLRELVPPGVADLFFFDGERIRTLAENEEGNVLLADTVKSLLGLDMVEQLERDLDIYISRELANSELGTINSELEERRSKAEELSAERATLRDRLHILAGDILQLHELIQQQEQRIATEGGWFARQRTDLQTKLQQLDAAIDGYRRQAQEMCAELVPFAIVPTMLSAVLNRLEREKAYHEWTGNQSLVSEQLEQIRNEIEEGKFWNALGQKPDQVTKDLLFKNIADALLRPLPDPKVQLDEVFLHVSDHDRTTLIHWMEQAAEAVPLRFSTLIRQLEQLEARREHVQANLDKVPADQTLRPLVERLNELHRQMGAREQERLKLEEEAQRLAYHTEQVEIQLRKVHERMAEQGKSSDRVQLGARTQLVLEEYRTLLARRKVSLLEESIVERFNRLCSKEQFIDFAKVDPRSFAVTLYRSGEAFARSDLSAGERQLLAIATMWALREVSDRPAPVIIDTPLSRLDSVHRLSMIQNFFPWVSHQVIILATDSEIDQRLRDRLQPAISHVYQMSYDPQSGRTVIDPVRLPSSVNGSRLISLEGISVE